MHQTFSSNNVMSVKRTRSLDNIFMFRESEKSLKGTQLMHTRGESNAP
jgi:hypothetical protein